MLDVGSSTTPPAHRESPLQTRDPDRAGANQLGDEDARVVTAARDSRASARDASMPPSCIAFVASDDSQSLRSYCQVNYARVRTPNAQGHRAHPVGGRAIAYRASDGLAVGRCEPMTYPARTSVGPGAVRTTAAMANFVWKWRCTGGNQSCRRVHGADRTRDSAR